MLGCERLSVLFENKSYDAPLVAVDQANDLALLKARVQLANIPAFRSSVRRGEAVAVIGYPYSGILATGGNFTLGNVTALAGLLDDSRQLQLSAPVQSGNSGGPVLDESGNVVGVIVTKLDVVKMLDVTDDVGQNINFAVKSALAVGFLESQFVPSEKFSRVNAA